MVATASPAKAKKPAASRAKKTASHPTYADMAAKAIAALKERNGSSRQAILKYIMANYNLGSDSKACNSRLKLALRKGIDNGSLKHHGKAVGANGSFKVAEKAKAKAAKPKKVVKKKAATPKKVAKKPAAAAGAAKKKSPAKKVKKASKPKKAAAKPKSPAKKAKKAPAKKAKKSPAKKVAKK